MPLCGLMNKSRGKPLARVLQDSAEQTRSSLRTRKSERVRATTAARARTSGARSTMRDWSATSTAGDVREQPARRLLILERQNLLGQRCPPEANLAWSHEKLERATRWLTSVQAHWTLSSVAFHGGSRGRYRPLDC